MGELREECNLSSDVQTVDDVPSRSLISRLTDHYLQIIANKAPIGFEAEFINHRGNNTLYRGILMPFSTDDDTIDFIYGVINWKEIADEALTNELNDAVEQALAQQPVRHAPTAPVWADGPSAAIVDEEIDDEDDFDEELVVLDGSEGLGDLLCAARNGADIAKHAEGRSRAKLYRALGLAYDFALVADGSGYWPPVSRVIFRRCGSISLPAMAARSQLRLWRNGQRQTQFGSPASAT